MAERPSFRIVVTASGRAAGLDRLLDRLAPQLARHETFRLVIVAHGADGAQRPLRLDRFGDRALLLQVAEDDPGLARRTGCANATEDYLVTTDADCLPPVDWLDRLLALAMVHPHVDLFAGTAEAERRGLMAGLPLADRGPAVYHRAWLIAAGTANTVWRRSLHDRLGGFAADLPGNGQAGDLAQRFQAAGCVWMLVPGLGVACPPVRSLPQLWRLARERGETAARLVIRSQDWRQAELEGGPPTLASGWRRAAAAAAKEWSKRRRRSREVPARLRRAIITLLAGLAFQNGWRSGVRRFQRAYGKGFPEPPVLAARFNDFCTEIRLTNAATPGRSS